MGALEHVRNDVEGIELVEPAVKGHRPARKAFTENREPLVRKLGEERDLSQAIDVVHGLFIARVGEARSPPLRAKRYAAVGAA